MMRVQRQQVKQEEAIGNPWPAVFSVNEEKTKTMMIPRPPSSSPPRNSKGTQTGNEKVKEEEEEESKEEERYNFVKRVDAMISFLNSRRKCWEAHCKVGSSFLDKKTPALPTPAPCGAPHPRPRR